MHLPVRLGGGFGTILNEAQAPPPEGPLSPMRIHSRSIVKTNLPRLLCHSSPGLRFDWVSRGSESV